MYTNVEDFIRKYASETDLCKNYKKYTPEIKKMLINIYSCCFRFNLYVPQTLFLLNSALKSFTTTEELIEL